MKKFSLFFSIIVIAILAFWLIPAKPLAYQNTEFGFSINLPSTWKNFTVINNSEWNGLSTNNQGESAIASGPMIIIRHPASTENAPRQDIPIMIFTPAQWNDLDKDIFHIGAAPVGPRELARNSKYVFALPARYNYAFPVGYEEVEQIINGNSVKAF